MEYSNKYQFFMSQLRIIDILKETDKTKISVVYHEGMKSSCILRICKGRDLSAVCMALRKIRNSNTVVVFDYVYENGDTYILEENVDGQTIEEIIEVDGCFSEHHTARVIIEVCKALEELHNLTPPVVHNDINPSNIKIREDGSVKLFDFDISRTYKKGQTKNTVLFGTEEYASPEHFGYGQSEPRTDIYCLGVTMHKMLTNEGLSNEHRISYNGRLKAIIKNCLEFDPKNRYSSVSGLRKDLERYLSSKKVFIQKAFITICIILVAIGGVLLSGILDWVNIDFVKSDIGSSTAQTEDKDETDMPSISSNMDGASVETEIDQEEVTEPAENQTTTEVVQQNHSRENARAIALNEEYSAYLGGNDIADWYIFTTSSDISVYRFCVIPDLAEDQHDAYTYTYLHLALYDYAGIKIKEVSAFSNDEYRGNDEGFFDIYLEPNVEYTIKVYGDGALDTTGNYRFSVSEMVCDAGVDKDSATELVIGTRHAAVLDSTLSDWYVFTAQESNQYTLTIHNIDVGHTIYFSGEHSGGSLFSGWARNEDKGARTFRAEKGDVVYFEIESNKKDANGNYILILESKG